MSDTLKEEIKRIDKLLNEEPLTSNPILDNYESLAKVFNNLTKQQFKSVTEIESLKDVILEKIESETVLRYKVLEQNNNLQRQNEELIFSLIYVMDLMSSLLEAVQKMQKVELIDPIERLVNETDSRMKSMGLIQVNETHTQFDSSIHYAIETKSDNKFKDETIIEVLKPGYIYEGRIIRRADVIVNKKN